MATTLKLRAVLYLRKSTTDKDRQTRSIDEQRADLSAADLRQRLGGEYAIVNEYKDERSGTREDRREFQRMMADAERTPRPFDVVLCWDVRRWGRMGADASGYYRHRLKLAGVRVVCLHGANSKIETSVNDSISEGESEGKGIAVLRSFRSRTLAGSRTTGAPPHGYDIGLFDAKGELIERRVHEKRRRPGGAWGTRVVRVQRGKSELPVATRRLLEALDRQAVETVRRIFRDRAAGKGLRTIAIELNRDGIPSPTGGTWSARAVAAIVQNRAYRGDLTLGVTSRGKFTHIENGEQVVGENRRRPPAQRATGHAALRENAHEALVAPALWDRAQAVARRNRTRPELGGRGATSPFLLSGLVTCGRCGAHRLWGSSRDGIGLDHGRYYACGGRRDHGSAVCDAPRVAAAALEAVVVEAVGAHLDAAVRAIEQSEAFLRDYAQGLDEAAGPGPRAVDHRAEIAKLQGQIGEDPEKDGELVAAIQRLRAAERNAAVDAARASVRLGGAEVAREAATRLRTARAALAEAVEANPQAAKPLLRELVSGVRADTRSGAVSVRLPRLATRDGVPSSASPAPEPSTSPSPSSTTSATRARSGSSCR